jgi:hypothetical protein
MVTPADPNEKERKKEKDACISSIRSVTAAQSLPPSVLIWARQLPHQQKEKHSTVLGGQPFLFAAFAVTPNTSVSVFSGTSKY